MNKSESIKELATALSKAQSEIKSAAKDAENPHFKAAYATLASVWDACRAPLTKNNLSVVQTLHSTPEGKIRCDTTLLHTSGEFISSSMPVLSQRQDMQGLGSAITYARRYALSALVGVAPDDDDDGNGAGIDDKKEPSTQKPKYSKPKDQTPPESKAKEQDPKGIKNMAPTPKDIALQELLKLSRQRNWQPEDVRDYVTRSFGAASAKDLTIEQIKFVIGIINSMSAFEAFDELDTMNEARENAANESPSEESSEQ